MGKMRRLLDVMMTGVRQAQTRSPADLGLPFEDVLFPASDGVALRGWLVSGTPGAPVVVWVHGWPWNRAGNVAGQVPWQDSDVSFLPQTKALHDAGFHVLLFDLANHGESGDRPPLTYGPWETRDVAGAVAFLGTRPEIAADRIGLIGTSAGGSTALYAAPDLPAVKALLVVQPTTVTVFAGSLARQEFGWFGPVLVRLSDILYWFRRAPLPSRHDPAEPAARLSGIPVQYVQGTGDQWGTMADVERMSAATPNSLGVIRYPSTERYGGYGYVGTANPDVVEFFRRTL